ncbi:MAG TPA: hypothetical protein VHR42_10315 [Clostridia bacterium]|nr:hypothetical protein [Clostridia bacterium]
MKRKLLISLLIFMVMIPMLSQTVMAADTQSILQEQTQKSGASDLYQKAPESAKSSLSQLGIKTPDSASLARFTPANLFRLVCSQAKEAAQKPIKAVLTIFGILMLCALLNTMKNTFAEKSLKTVFDVVCGLCIAAAIMVPVSQCITQAAQVIEQSSQFMLSVLPVFSGLVIASGHPASGALYQGFLVAVSQVISQIAATTFVPMISIYLGFCVIGSVSPGIQINSVAKFFKNIVTWGVVLLLTAFTGILTVQGLISQAADTVTMKTAKFVVGSVVPVIGSTISDAMNTVVGCANLLKTATGAYAIVVFLFMYLPPVINCVLWILAAEISLAFADLLGINNMSGLLNSVKQALQVLIALILTAALAMIISISVMLLLGMVN